ncbi:MAG: reverse transcriptase domain-containing protein [Steroidobacteraceae bacterium]
MTDALTSLGMSTGLRKVAERAKREPAARFHSLAHLIDEQLLAGAYARLRSDAAVGVDGITKEQYGQDLESNLKDLRERLKTKRYRHQPIRRVHIPKEKQGQSRPLSPLLGNVYLHTVLDRWFAEEVRPRLRGKATCIRYADDGVFGFERQEDAERVMAVLSKRMERFGLTLHPEKTRLLDFRRPLRSRGEGRSPTAFDFLGFCWYYRRTRAGNWTVACKTRRARLARAIQRVYAWCRDNRHLSVREQHAQLVRRVRGHINYFGVNGNIVSLRRFVHQAQRSGYKWLNRRSQRARLNWERFEDLLEAMPLPNARIVVHIWR